MSSGELPLQIKEQFVKLEQTQQNLQSIVAQKQHTEMEQAETDKAIEELQKASNEDSVYKFAGSILVKSTKQELMTHLEEKKEMAKTRFTVLEKQEQRVMTSLKEQESKITEIMKSEEHRNPQQGTSPDYNPRR